MEEIQRRELLVLIGPNLGLRLVGTQRQPHSGADVEVGVGVDGGEGERFGHRWIGSGGARGHYSDSSTNFGNTGSGFRSEEHTSELQSRFDLVCRLLLEKQNND